MSLVLAFHIATSIITILACSYAWYAPSKFIQSRVHIFTLTSLVSGFYVTNLPSGFTPIFCAKIGVYLLMIVATQIMLTHSIKNQALRIATLR